MKLLTRFRILLLSGLLLGLMLVRAPVAQAQQDQQVVDEIVAVVENDIILRSDVNALVANFIQQSQTSFSTELWMEALNELISQKVLAAHARRDTTIQVTDEQVDQTLERRIDQMAAQLGSRSRIEEAYGKSIVQIKADLRKDFRERMLAEQFQSRHLQKISVTPSEIRQFFEEIPQDSLPVLPTMVQASHIVRYPQPSTEQRQEARDIITTIRDSIVTGGASLEEMARQFSDDPGSAAAGGRLQDVNLDDLFPEFAAVATRLDTGQISQVFETPLGFHIMRLNERRGDVVDFNHILIRIDNSRADPAEAIAYLNTVRDSIMTGEASFALMARRHSEEEFTAQRGGRIVDPRTGDRNLALEELGPSWTRTLNGMEEGEISEPAEVELLDGERAYHIVKLEKRIPEHRVDLDTDYERIRQLALNQKQARMMDKWLQELRKDVYVDVRVEPGDLSIAQF